MLAVLACLLAAFITPSAHAAATYDITQVGDAKFVSVTDTNGIWSNLLAYPCAAFTIGGDRQWEMGTLIPIPKINTS